MTVVLTEPFSLQPRSASVETIGRLRRGQLVDAEELTWVGPYAGRQPVGQSRQLLELADRVLVGVLGVDGLAGVEGNAPAADPDALVPQADQVHLDPPVA